MYHSGHNDLICKLVLSHSDLLPQVTVTLVKGLNPILSDHPEAWVHLEQVWTKERRENRYEVYCLFKLMLTKTLFFSGAPIDLCFL